MSEHFIRVCERLSLMAFECDTAQFKRPTNRALSDGHKTALHLLLQLIHSFSHRLLLRISLFNTCKCNQKKITLGVCVCIVK